MDSVVLVFFIPSSANAEHKVVAVLRDAATFARWLAVDEYEFRMTRRTSCHPRYGWEVVTVWWNGTQVGIGANQQEGYKIRSDHRAGKDRMYTWREEPVRDV